MTSVTQHESKDFLKPGSGPVTTQTLLDLVSHLRKNYSSLEKLRFDRVMYLESINAYGVKEDKVQNQRDTNLMKKAFKIAEKQVMRKSKSTVIGYDSEESEQSDDSREKDEYSSDDDEDEDDGTIEEVKGSKKTNKVKAKGVKIKFFDPTDMKLLIDSFREAILRRTAIVPMFESGMTGRQWLESIAYEINRSISARDCLFDGDTLCAERIIKANPVRTVYDVCLIHAVYNYFRSTQRHLVDKIVKEIVFSKHSFEKAYTRSLEKANVTYIPFDVLMAAERKLTHQPRSPRDGSTGNRFRSSKKEKQQDKQQERQLERQQERQQDKQQDKQQERQTFTPEMKTNKESHSKMKTKNESIPFMIDCVRNDTDMKLQMHSLMFTKSFIIMLRLWSSLSHLKET